MRIQFSPSIRNAHRTTGAAVRVKRISWLINISNIWSFCASVAHSPIPLHSPISQHPVCRVLNQNKIHFVKTLPLTGIGWKLIKTRQSLLIFHYSNSIGFRCVQAIANWFSSIFIRLTHRGQLDIPMLTMHKSQWNSPEALLRFDTWYLQPRSYRCAADCVSMSSPFIRLRLLSHQSSSQRNMCFA